MPQRGAQHVIKLPLETSWHTFPPLDDSRPFLSHTFYCNFCRGIEYSLLYWEHRYIKDRYTGVPLYCQDNFFHLSQFMTKFTFEQCLFFCLLFNLAKKSHQKFSCLSYKAFFISQILQSSHFSSKECEVSCIN